MLEYTPKFDDTVKSLRKKLGGDEWVRVDEGNMSKSAVLRTTTGEFLAATVRYRNGKEVVSKQPFPEKLKLQPFHKPKR